MKKRNLLVALFLVLTMFITGCNSTESPFEGEWKGTCDLTDYIVESMVASEPTMEEYIEFEELSFVIDFTFEGDEVSMSVDEDSVDTFIERAEDGIRNMMDAYMTDLVADFNGLVTMDDVVAENGYDSYEALLDGLVESMDLSTVVESLCEELELEGTFEYDEKDGILTVTYDDEFVEEMEFEFDGDDLVITVSDGTDEFDIKCEKK